VANVKKALEAIRSLTAPDSFLAPEAKTALHELRMKRASEQGFGDNYYHASQQDIDEFVPGYSDGLTFLTPDAKFANEWLGKGKFRGRQGAKDAEDVLYEEMRQWKRDYYDEFARKEGYKDFDDLYDKAPDAPLDELYDNIYKDKAKAFPVEIDDLGKTIYPVRSNVKNTFDPEKDIAVIDDYIDSIKGTNKELDRKIFEQGHYLAYENPEVVQHLKDKGYDSVSLRESTIMGNEKKPYTTLAVFDPKNIRSTNAQFLDPTSKKLLASAAGVAALSEDDAEASEQYLSDIAGVAKENVLGLAGKGVDYLIDKWDEFNNAAKENLPPGLFNMLSTDWTGRQIREKPVEARNAILGGTTELLQDMGYDAQRNEHSKSDAEFGNKIDFIADLWQANPWTWFDGESK